MQKIASLIAFVFIVCYVSPFAFAQDTGAPGMEIGLSLPTIGWYSHNDEGLAKNVSGVNIGLGFSWRAFPDGLKAGQFNFYWGWGTVILIIPYLEAGFRYPVALNDEASNLFNIDIGLFYIAPYISISASF